MYQYERFAHLHLRKCRSSVQKAKNWNGRGTKQTQTASINLLFFFCLSFACTFYFSLPRHWKGEKKKELRKTENKKRAPVEGKTGSGKRGNGKTCEDWDGIRPIYCSSTEKSSRSFSMRDFFFLAFSSYSLVLYCRPTSPPLLGYLAYCLTNWLIESAMIMPMPIPMPRQLFGRTDGRAGWRADRHRLTLPVSNTAMV